MSEKYITLIAIWYFGWFLFSAISAALKVDMPRIKIGSFDIIGNNIYTFIPASLWIVWTYILN